MIDLLHAYFSFLEIQVESNISEEILSGTLLWISVLLIWNTAPQIFVYL